MPSPTKKRKLSQTSSPPPGLQVQSMAELELNYPDSDHSSDVEAPHKEPNVKTESPRRSLFQDNPSLSPELQLGMKLVDESRRQARDEVQLELHTLKMRLQETEELLEGREKEVEDKDRQLEEKDRLLEERVHQLQALEYDLRNIRRALEEAEKEKAEVKRLIEETRRTVSVFEW